MTAAQRLVQRQDPKAPRQNRTAVVSAPLDEIGAMLETNARFARRQASTDVNGRTLARVAADARQEMLLAAWNYTRQYRDVSPPNASAPVLLAGHQPQLFHPGVWFKNFTLQHLAEQHGGTAINLVIDSDAVKDHSLRVPGGSLDRPEVRNIPFDVAGTALPYEERAVLDPLLFDSFAERTLPWLAPLVAQPMLAEYWNIAQQRRMATGNLGEAISQSRHIWEARWGGQTLELPQSSVCQSESFYWFTAHMLAHLPRLWQVFNDALIEFRRQNKLRSATHPVPNLARDEDWFEAPFWIWSRQDPRRRPLFARTRHQQVQISDRAGVDASLPLSEDMTADRAAAALAGLADRGVKIRTRALLTTLWARVALGDLFLHGIGGAKYDQLTDRLICRFFGLQPPRYLTVSATLLLPIPQGETLRDKSPDDAVRQLAHRERELLYHPEKFLQPDQLSPADREAALKLVAAKQAYLACAPSAIPARARHKGLRAVNEELQSYLALPRQQLAVQRAEAAENLRLQAILGSREYAFCLFPAETLRNFIQQALS